MNLVHPITHRDMLGYFLNERGLVGEGVEVGSAFGQFAGRILSTWKGETLYMVDPWARQENNDYLEKTNETAPFDEWYLTCQDLAKRDARAKLMKGFSVEVAKDFKNCSLDFCYIDGNHSHGAVMADLDAWFPRVRAGGLIGGHDFYNNTEGGSYCQVADAVLRWTKEHDIPFTITPACTSWWFIKT